jgi:hypothetical protein
MTIGEIAARTLAAALLKKRKASRRQPRGVTFGCGRRARLGIIIGLAAAAAVRLRKVAVE